MRVAPSLCSLLAVILVLPGLTWGQQAPPLIHPDERFKADILVIVAHPDDETAISSYLARAIFDQHKRVAVIFGTRGDAGGNSVGYEQAAALGTVREIEARRALATLGVMNVWFLGGPDTPGQDVLRSLETWKHGNALEQAVRLVRLTRPEVILTWLPCYVVGENHDDHQAAGVIATEAFDSAGDPTVFPSQVSAPRNRTNIGNLTEGLTPWQTKKLYYFSDASHTEFQQAKGPQYSPGDMSPSRNVPYYRISADEWSHHKTQGEAAEVARRAIESGDFKALQDEERFVLGKSLVKSSPTDDIFAGVSGGAIEFSPVRGFRPQRSAEVEIKLGGPWEFYKKFWQAHNIEHLERLLEPEAGIGGAQTLSVPLLITNGTNKPVVVRLMTELPQGWTEHARFAAYPLEPGETYPVQTQLESPKGRAKEWQQLSWSIEVDGKAAGSVKLRVFITSQGLPQ